ncbi:hypothetical protein [Vaginisenegalia massiliensis]|uniref:hypothetical protein n=1 Tax=Vaginisenegalia massiliensis TaxID=2058294 RepID=UPI000F536DB1|nr:hypothetical protein [Vaginisenegalia massiliensis]
MELPVNFSSSNRLVKHIHHAFKPFFQEEEESKVQRFIMPLHQVEQKLHHHYVSQKPLKICFEFYEDDNQIQQSHRLVTVVSTVQADRRIAVKELDSNRHYLLLLDQILSVSANIA